MTRKDFTTQDVILIAKIKGLENDISYIVESIRMLSDAKENLTRLLQSLYDDREGLHDEYYNQKGSRE